MQLICNYKKAQVSCRIKVTEEQLKLAMSPKKRMEDAAVTSLRVALRDYQSHLEYLQDKLPKTNRRELDVKDVCNDFVSHYGFIKKQNDNNLFVTSPLKSL